MNNEHLDSFNIITMTKKKSKSKEAKVNKPEVEYSKWKLKIFHSFEEANEFDAMECAKLSPIENLQNTTELIKRIFANELSKKYLPNKIYFK
jgi:hypothetical protein